MIEPIVWVIADDRAGNVNQAIGVAEALDLPYEVKSISYSKWAKLPNFIRNICDFGITTESKSDILNDADKFPDIIISAGRKSAPFCKKLKKLIKKRAKKKCFLVHIMNPGGFGFRKFDLLAIPAHDKKVPKKTNVITIISSPHRVTQATLAEAKQKWQSKFYSLPYPKIALIVGGATKDYAYTEEMAKKLMELANSMKNVGSLLVTTSRRTPKQVVEIIEKNLGVNNYMYKWEDEDDNPYFGYLACADKIIVTGDSVSMCSEVCASGKPVYIYAPEDMTSDKHKRLHQNLYHHGLAKPLDDNALIVNSCCYSASDDTLLCRSSPLNSADYIAKEMKKRCHILQQHDEVINNPK